jgi:murein DD-endopeptidase MepM/ murein hydrolase activator NlpD
MRPAAEAPSHKPRKKRARSTPWKATLRLGVVFATLIAINLYFFFFRGGTSVGDLVKLSENKDLQKEMLPPTRPKPASVPPGAPIPPGRPRPAAAPGTASDAEVDVPDEGRMASGTIGAADTLLGVLRREGIPQATANEVVVALTRLFDPKKASAGNTWTLLFDPEEHLHALEYRTGPTTLYRVERRAPTKSGKVWRASRESAPLETRIVEVSGVADPSLWDAVKRAGEAPALASRLADIFAWDVNLYTDAAPADHFRLVVEKLYLGETFHRYGHILAAEWAGRAGTFRAFWFDPGGDHPAGYYNERGESVMKTLLRSPLRYARVAPAFDKRRFHPVLHTERAHLGVDWAAPTGTPVWATAAGKVSFRGVARGGAGGETVVINHPGGMESTYMHLSRLAAGLEVGQPVRPEQVIGYVGRTAGPPHLHYSVKMGGHFVDPLRLKPAREAPLVPALREDFLQSTAPRFDQLARIEVRPLERRVGRAAAPAAAAAAAAAANAAAP